MAKFTIGTAEMKKAMSFIDPMLKNGIDSQPRILFIVEDKITASATNGEAYAKIQFDADIEEKGKFVISGVVFMNILKAFKGEKIAISSDENRVEIVSGTLSFRTSIIDGREEYFEAPMFENAGTFKVNSKELKNAISSVSCCIDQSKQHLNCVLFQSVEEEKGKIFVVATDGMRLGIDSVSGSYENEVPNLLVPKKSADIIVSMLGDIETEITVKYTDSMVQIEISGMTYTSKLLETAFPKYRSVIPTANDKILEVKTKDLLTNIKSVASASQITFRIKLAISKDKTDISCEDNGTDGSSSVESTYSDAQPLDMVCNYNLLSSILEKIDSTLVRIQIANAESPILIKPLDNDNLQYVFMPFVQ